MVHIFEDLLSSQGELLRARGLESVARRRLVDSLLRLARRVPTAAEARACCVRAIEVRPVSVAAYLHYIRALAGRR